MSESAACETAPREAPAAHLLIPVDASERSRWGVQYALRLQRSGRPVQVALLFVAEPVTSLEVLRFRTHDDIARFQAEGGRHILHDAAQPLLEAGVSCQEIYREGDAAFQINDVAEQLGCDEIVLPLPHARIARLLSRDLVREVIKRTSGVPVVTANAEGIAEKCPDTGM
ncbi:MAG: universal stress protein [Betaproteobacteria bacterium]|nr:universal stress protein [Betaproteobacteria bacterium]